MVATGTRTHARALVLVLAPALVLLPLLVYELQYFLDPKSMQKNCPKTSRYSPKGHYFTYFLGVQDATSFVLRSSAGTAEASWWRLSRLRAAKLRLRHRCRQPGGWLA